MLDRNRLQCPGNFFVLHILPRSPRGEAELSIWPFCFSSPWPSLALIWQIWFTACASAALSPRIVSDQGHGEIGKETEYGSGCGKVPPCLIREERKWIHLASFWLWSEVRWAKVPGVMKRSRGTSAQCSQDSAAHHLFHFTKIYFLLGFSLPVSIA